MSIVIFIKNFSKEYIQYLSSKIPINLKKIYEKDQYYITYKFNSKSIGYIYGSKQDEDNEIIRFNFVNKNEPYSLDIDDLHEFLIHI